jgi:hypothetical protein
VHAAVKPATPQEPAAGDTDPAYDETDAPPLSTGSVHVNDTDPSPGVAASSVGTPGTVRGVTDTEAAGPVPSVFVAVTLNW